MNEERLTKLEIQFSHQDELVDQLNRIVTRQQLIIDQLHKDVQEIKRIHAETGASGAVVDKAPPHY